jgi:mycofactocin system FadH/OYE family oxidoreductase 1
MRLLEPLTLGSRTAPNRVVFGPHETNLGWGRSLSERHVAYYRRRAAGGCGTIVVEEASVHPSDWPYERAPLAARCTPGWADVVAACRPFGALVLAGLGHAGGQGTSAFSQRELWAPSDEPEVNSREVPKVMEVEDIAAVVDGFRHAAKLAAEADCDGVEVNAGQHSLIRQFLSGLTNRREDAYGADRARFAREVLVAARAGLGRGRVLGLRLSCDELAPWAGITPEQAEDLARELAPLVDYLVVVRGGIFSVAETRPDGHHPPGFNLDLAGGIRAAAGVAVPVVAQGSIVDWGQAEWAVAEGRCDAVEMTRAQLAEPDLVAKLAAGTPERIRPCILCNQWCKVRDNRNPIVSCVGEPRTGHELGDPDPAGRTPAPRDLLVVGGGPAGLETARVAAARGHRVRLVERGERLGGMVRTAAVGAGRDRLAALVDWLETECRAEGVTVETGSEPGPELTGRWRGEVVLATGSRPAPPRYAVAEGAVVLHAADVLDAAGSATLDDLVPLSAAVAVWDPVGGPVGVSVAELLAGAGRPVAFVTPDAIAATLLSLTGDLAPANARLAQAGVDVVRRATLRGVDAEGVTVEDRFTAERRRLPATVLVDAGARLPADELWRATGERLTRAGDVVAPRTIGEAVLEGRRAALALDGFASDADHGTAGPSGLGAGEHRSAGEPATTWHRPVAAGARGPGVGGRGRADDARGRP